MALCHIQGETVCTPLFVPIERQSGIMPYLQFGWNHGVILRPEIMLFCVIFGVIFVFTAIFHLKGQDIKND